MSASRLSFEQLIQTTFLDNAIKAKLTAIAKHQMQRKNANRVFDEFPASSLIDNDVLKLLRQKFKEIISSIHFISEIDIDNVGKLQFLLTTEEKNKLQQWELFIIQLACDDLLDRTTNKIKKNILSELGWQDWESSLNSTSIISAYVGAIYQNVTFQQEEIETIFANNEHAQSAVFAFINDHTHDWVQTEMMTPSAKITLSIDSPYINRIRIFGEQINSFFTRKTASAPPSPTVPIWKRPTSFNLFASLSELTTTPLKHIDSPKLGKQKK